jgi:hypothetical protein
MAGIAMPIVGAVGSLIGGFLGSSGAKAAGQTIANKAGDVATSINKATSGAIDAGYAGMNQANNALGTGLTNATGALNGVYGTEMGNLSPYLAAGSTAINQLSAMNPFSFTGSDVANDPGYQFRLQQGEQAIQRSQAASGALGSGGTAKALAGYGQDMASQEYQNAFNRALTTYGTNVNTLGTLAGFGQNANSQAITAGNNYGNQTAAANLNTAGEQSNVAMQGNQYVGNTGLAGAEAAGNVYMQGAQGYAAGQMGSANAWSNAVGGMTNNLGTLFMPKTPAGPQYANGGQYTLPYPTGAGGIG